MGYGVKGEVGLSVSEVWWGVGKGGWECRG